jgi:APA family basic amino acid/polyamine antiporter
VVGKLASCAAMALTFGSYAWPGHERALAVAAVLALTAVNYVGIEKTALLTRAIVAAVLVALAVVVFAALYGGDPQPRRLLPAQVDLYGILQAGGLWFFAFAGFARLATLGEEVVDPARTLPRAIPLALGLTLVAYAVVAVSVLLVVDIGALAGAAAPLALAVESGALPGWTPVVRIGATIAALGVLLSLIVGVSRTVFAMAANRDLPGRLAAVHPRFRVPHRAELAVGAVVAVAAALVDLRTAIGFSAFTVLGYYALTNAAALTLSASERRWPRWIAAAGLAGCAVLAFSLPVAAVIAGAAVLSVGAIAFLLRARLA